MRQIQNLFFMILLATSAIFGSPLTYTSDYNVLVFGSMSATSSIGGSVAVGGSASFTNLGLATGNNGSSGLAPATGSDALNLIVGGSLSWTSGQLHQGSGVYGGAAALTWIGTPNGSINFGTVPADFNALATEARTASTEFAAMAANGTSTYNPWGGLLMKGTDTGLNVFTIDGSKMSSLNNVQIEVPEGAAVLINVTGVMSSFKYSGLTLNGKAFNYNDRENWGEVLWNFNATGSFEVNGVQFGGTLLAPNAAVTLVNGQLNGQVIASSLTTSAMINNYTFAGSSLPESPANEAPVPEPGTYLLTACGLALLFVGRIKRTRD